jgi:hypothetical protein
VSKPEVSSLKFVLRREFGAFVEYRPPAVSNAPEELYARTFRFACNVYDFCDELARVPACHGALPFNCSTLPEASEQTARRRRLRTAEGSEFAAKNAISLKESREAKFWLRLADAKGLGDRMKRVQLLREVNQLIVIFHHSCQEAPSRPCD